MKLFQIMLIFLCVCNGTDSFANALQRNLERSFATSVVLSDNEALTFGVSNFDPNSIFNIDNDNFGDAKSVDLRQRIEVLTAPFSFAWEDHDNEHNSHNLNVKLLFVQMGHRVEFVESGIVSDTFEESVYGGYIGYSYHDQLTENWYLNYGVGGYLLFYKNTYNYNNRISRTSSSELDGVVYNTEAWAFLVEPQIQIRYIEKKEWGFWQVSSGISYFNGEGWGEANYGNVGNPENIRWINQVELFYDLPQWKEMAQSVFVTFKKVSLKGDSTSLLETKNYYELMGGWLVAPSFKPSWVDNIGIGLSFNYGSVLKGGSIVIYFNQD